LKEVEEHYEGKYLEPLRKADTLYDSSGYMTVIPFSVDHLTRGEIKIESKVDVCNYSVTAFRCELYDDTNGSLVYSKDIQATAFDEANTYKVLDVGMTGVLDPNHSYQLSVYFTKTVSVWIDTIRLLE
jgi:hypothetical protein